MHVKINVISCALKPQASGPVSVDDVTYAVSEEIRELLPATVRQFNLWQSQNLPEAVRITLPAFGKNANKTLHTAGLYRDVQRVVDAVAASRTKTISKSRAERISEYQRNVDLAKRLREIAEDEVIRLKRQLQSALNRNTDLARQLEELRARTARIMKSVDNG